MNPMLNNQQISNANGNDYMQALQQGVNSLQNNPEGFFRKANVNVPQNIINNPDAIIQHWVSNGTYSQQQVNNAMQMLQRIRNGRQ